jgi:hypothetical protein
MIVEFTGGRRCTGCGGWIDPARVRIFASAVICEPCRNLRRRALPSSPGARHGALHLVPPDREEADASSDAPGEVPADQF